MALLSGGGVGFGDKLEMIDEQLIRSTCRADGRLLKISKPLGATPLQLRYMAKVFHFSSSFINAKYKMQKYISLSEIFLLYHYVHQSYKQHGQLLYRSSFKLAFIKDYRCNELFKKQ